MKKTKRIGCGIIVFLLLVSSGCTSATRSIEITVEEGGCFRIGSFNNAVEVKKGDETLSSTADISPALEVPLL